MNPMVLMLASGLLVSGAVFSVRAETTVTPKAQYAADSQRAQTRYDADKKLCNDETSSSARLQCRRDAKAEYDKAITLAKAHLKTTAPVVAPVVAAKAHEPQMTCNDCGKVAAVSVTEKEGEGGPAGLIAGGAAGAILGHQVGSGMGKDLATIAGAVGGAYAGKKIEEKVKTHKVWSVNVQYADGIRKSFDFDKDPGLKVGDAVKNSGNTIVRN